MSTDLQIGRAASDIVIPISGTEPINLKERRWIFGMDNPSNKKPVKKQRSVRVMLDERVYEWLAKEAKEDHRGLSKHISYILSNCYMDLNWFYLEDAKNGNQE